MLNGKKFNAFDAVGRIVVIHADICVSGKVFTRATTRYYPQNTFGILSARDRAARLAEELGYDLGSSEWSY